ncbi:MAG: CapA family protein [Thermomicrobium sp.]|nr:CapA family protein [Thermomicrobium sp.]
MTGEKPPAAIGGRWLVPVSGHANLVRDVPPEAFQGLLDGSIGDWAEAGAPEHLPVRRISVLDDGYRFATAETAVGRVRSLATIPDPGLFALVEPSALAPFLRVLRIAGQDPLRPDGNDALLPGLVEWLVVEGPLDLLPPEPFAPFELPRLRTTTLTFAGDIVLGRTVHRIMAARNDWSAPFRGVASELGWADLTVANLECALTVRYLPPDDPYTLRFLTLPDAVAGLELAGIDAVSLANNHSMDFGPLALFDTQEILRKADIASFGAGRDLDEAVAPRSLEVGDVTVALLGFDGVSAGWYGAGADRPGTAPLEPELVQRAIRAAAAQADIVIPFFHWGVEYTLIPTETQRKLARIAIDSGATLVVGSHPHWVQGMEWYRGKPIFYSLGNFVFDQEWSLETKQGLILHLWFHGAELVRYDLVPVLIEDYHRPRLVEGRQAFVILARVRSSSEALASSPLAHP